VGTTLSVVSCLSRKESVWDVPLPLTPRETSVPMNLDPQTKILAMAYTIE